MFKLDDVSDHAANGANCRNNSLCPPTEFSFGSRRKWREL